MNRQSRAAAAKHTLAVLESGEYTLANGAKVSIAAQLAACLGATRLYEPAELEALLPPGGAASTPAAIELRNETTLQGIARLHAAGVADIGALNFASARNPGGGFQGGAQAQEESLARSSALYASQLRAGDFYERHRRASSLLYSDAMIFSPRCPVFRDDAGELLADPHAASFITCAAPNAGAVRANQPADVQHLPRVLQRRAGLVLALAAHLGLRCLVLGAWGCGVFRNDPAEVAGIFGELLFGPAEWSRRFDRVVFSVFDAAEAQPTFRAFERTLPRG